MLETTPWKLTRLFTRTLHHFSLCRSALLRMTGREKKGQFLWHSELWPFVRIPDSVFTCMEVLQKLQGLFLPLGRLRGGRRSGGSESCILSFASVDVSAHYLAVLSLRLFIFNFLLKGQRFLQRLVQVVGSLLTPSPDLFRALCCLLLQYFVVQCDVGMK